MRTKEIEEAMELFEKVRVNSGLCAYITKKDVKKAAILSEYIKELENYKQAYELETIERQKIIEVNNELREKTINAIAECERHKEGIRILELKNKATEEELETYKKMVEKLAERIIERMKETSSLDGNCYEEFGVTFCKRANDDCNKCIIDWARKELENE